MTSRVRVLAEQFMANPQYVFLRPKRIREVATLLQDKDLSVPTYEYIGNVGFEEICQYYLTFNAINYCYFDEDGNRMVRDELNGSTLVCKSLAEHWEDLKNPLFLSNVDENYLMADVFRCPTSLIKERTRALRELGNFLLRNDDFTFEKLFSKYQNNAYLVSQVVPHYLPSWRDPFFKRAQLFVAMVYGRFQNDQVPVFSDESLKDLTVFADYRVPQTLNWMGAIYPCQRLEADIAYRKPIPSGSFKELELRAATVVAVDKLVEDLRDLRRDENINVVQVDALLWLGAKRPELLPEGTTVGVQPDYHRTMTTDY